MRDSATMAVLALSLLVAPLGCATSKRSLAEPTSSTETIKSSDVEFNQAVNAYRAGRFRDCQLLCQKVLAARPFYVEAELLLARAYRDGGLWRSAVIHYQRVLQLLPSHRDARIELTDLQSEHGQSTAAIETSRIAVQHDPEDSEALLALARAHASKGEDAEALTYIQKAIRLNPRDPRPHTVLMAYYCERGRYDLAHEAASGARRAGAPEAAIAKAEAQIRPPAPPPTPPPPPVVGPTKPPTPPPSTTSTNRNDEGTVILDIPEIPTPFPKSTLGMEQAVLLKMTVEVERAKKDEAARMLVDREHQIVQLTRRAIMEAVSSGDVTQEVLTSARDGLTARILKDINNPMKGLVTSVRITALTLKETSAPPPVAVNPPTPVLPPPPVVNPPPVEPPPPAITAPPPPPPTPPTGNAAAFAEMGDDLLKMGKTEQAIAAYQEALERHPNEPELQRKLADAFRTTGKDDRVLAYYTDRIKTHPYDAESHLILAETYLRQNAMTQARAHAETAAILAPKTARAQAMLGSACVKAGDRKAAAAAYRRALAIEPWNEEYQKALQAVDESATPTPDAPAPQNPAPAPPPEKKVPKGAPGTAPPPGETPK